MNPPLNHLVDTVSCFFSTSHSNLSIPLVSIAFLLSPKNEVFFRVILNILGEKRVILPTLYFLGKVLNLKLINSLWFFGNMGR